MLGFVIAQVFAVFRGTFIRCIRRGRRDSGTVPVLLLEVFEKGVVLLLYESLFKPEP